MRSCRRGLVWRRCSSWRNGRKNVWVRKEEPHVQQQPPCAPPSPATLAVPTRAQGLWPQLTQPQRQALVRLLSELIQRRLLDAAGKEVADESR